jgi:hypothetical protein
LTKEEIMTKHRRNLWSLTVALVLLAVPTALMAGDQAPEATHGGMEMTEPQAMPEMCKKMMAEREDMKLRVAAMDDRLDSLVTEMNAAKGKAKTEAVAKVVTELVAQRKQMRSMMDRQPMMMQHMMEHMQKGMMQGMKEGMMQSMQGCPMMKGTAEKTEEGGEPSHSEHHPD